MNLGSIGQSMLFYAGMNPGVERQTEMAQADVQLKQVQVQEAQMKLQQDKQQVAMYQQMGQYIKNQESSDATLLTDPIERGKLYGKAASLAMGNGDFADAESMSKLAKGQYAEANQVAVTQGKQKQAAQETMASSAWDYVNNPTPVTASILVNNAVAAGVDPRTIPKDQKSPAFIQWAKSGEMAAAATGKRVELATKISQYNSTREFEQQKFEADEQDKASNRELAARRQVVSQQLRKSMDANKVPKLQEFPDGMYEFDPEGAIKGPRQATDSRFVKVSGPKLTAQEKSADTAAIRSSSEADRGFKIIAALPAGQSAGAFSGLRDGTVLEALSKVGTNVITPQSYQMYQTATEGLGQEVGRILTLGGGRGVNEAQIQEYKNMVTVMPGDSEFEAMFKYANAVDIVRNNLETMPEVDDPTLAARRTEMLREFSKIPTPEQVIALAAKHHASSGLFKQYSSMQGALDAIKAGNTGEKSGGKSNLSSSDQALINKYL